MEIDNITCWDENNKKLIQPNELHKFNIFVDESGALGFGYTGKEGDWHELEIISCKMTK